MSAGGVMDSEGPETALGPALLLALALIAFLQPPVLIPGRYALLLTVFGRAIGLGLTALAGLAFTCALDLEDAGMRPIKAVPRYLSGGLFFLGLALVLDPRSAELELAGLFLAGALLLGGLVLGARCLAPRLRRAARRASGVGGLSALAGASLGEGLVRFGPWEATALRALACVLLCLAVFALLRALKSVEGEAAQ